MQLCLLTPQCSLLTSHNSPSLLTYEPMGASTDPSQQFIDPSEQATYPSDQSTGPSVCSQLTVHWNIHIVQLSGVSRLLFKLLKYHYCWDLHGVYIGQDALHLSHLYMKIHVTVLGFYTSIFSFLSYLYLSSLSFLSFLSLNWCLSYLCFFVPFVLNFWLFCPFCLPPTSCDS